MVTGEFTPMEKHRLSLRDYYRRDEGLVLDALLPLADLGPVAQPRAWNRARKLVVDIRDAQVGKGGVDALLNEFALSTEEGIVLMCLAEALLRVPDKLTTDRLIRDKLTSGDWGAHLGNSDSLFVNASAWGLLLTGHVVSYGDEGELHQRARHKRQIGLLKKTVARLGEPVIRAAVRYAMQIMGTQFVMGKTIGSALERAQKQEAKGYRYSYDMLGEGARTMADADRYFQNYGRAIECIGRAAGGRGPIESPGISVKLSAIHPRYEYSHRERVMAELVPRLKALVLAARQYDIGLTVDAEEADRLDLSLDVIEAVFSDSDLNGWEGFGLAIQAYQKRALPVVGWVSELAQKVGRKMMVRLVKGAYWDSEIKWSQEGGYSDYPVFTCKPATDVSYQACARKLLAYRHCIYPQFATHNAYTVATILELDSESASSASRQGYEFQRLHGMGEALYDQILPAEGVPCRIYAPVGEHADLLAYLVRRLLENGANSSFVNNIVDESVPVESLLEDPVETVSARPVRRNTAIPLPPNLYAESDNEPGLRRNAAGCDLSDVNTLRELVHGMEAWWCEQQIRTASAAGTEAVINPANRDQLVGRLSFDNRKTIDSKLVSAQQALAPWRDRPVRERAAFLRRLADSLETHRSPLIALCSKEAGKTIADGVAEVREAVDFCRYYADRGEGLLADGELEALGVVLCISPWNFPVAIFIGQVSAALVAGNTVLAKPAEQTSLVADYVHHLIKECEFPIGVVELIISPGKPVGEQLVPDRRIQGVMFTGSTETGHWLARTIARREQSDIPLIAETGGQNAMIVDSTALPEQVVDDVIRSGFQSAGQRCSALRVLFLQEEVASRIIHMIKGAMKELSIGDPALLSTDVGPVIDAKALARLEAHRHYLADIGDRARLLHACELPSQCSNGYFFAPHLYEVADLSVLQREVFGPVVHVVRYKAYELDKVIDQINATGYGLTLGVHSRIEAVSERIADRAKVGNVYVNRNMIGAIVGVQPFGGRGLSGTGPKAGGPLYVRRLLKRKRQALQPFSERAVAPTILGGDMPEAHCLAQAELAQLSWSVLPVQQRVLVVRRLLAALALEPLFKKSLTRKPQQVDIDPFDNLLECGRALTSAMDKGIFQPKPLPGPTGESNQLFLESRGLVAVLFDEFCSDNRVIVADSLLRIVAALLAGNAVVTLTAPEFLAVAQRCGDLLREAGLPEHVCSVQPLSVAKVVLSDPRVQAALVSTESALKHALFQLLVEREGALIPMITEAPGADLVMRLVIEKTVTIDTTAAGGNASLMTMAKG